MLAGLLRKFQAHQGLQRQGEAVAFSWAHAGVLSWSFLGTPSALAPMLLCCVLLPSRAHWGEVQLKKMVLHTEGKGKK